DILDTLHHVDMYLESIGKPKQYELVNKHEYAFKQLKKCRNKIKDSSRKTIFTTIAYALLSNQTESGRLWGAIPAVEENLDKIISNLQDELVTEIDVELDDDISLLDDEESDFETLIITLSNPENNDKIIEIVDDVLREQKETERENKSKKYVFSQLNKANTAIKNAINGLNKDTELTGIQSQLDEIQSSLEKLREMLSKYAVH